MAKKKIQPKQIQSKSFNPITSPKAPMFILYPITSIVPNELNQNEKEVKKPKKKKKKISPKVKFNEDTGYF